MSRTHHTFTKAELEKIRAEYPLRGGVIADEMGLLRRVVRSKAQRMGIPYRWPSCGLSAEEIDTAVRFEGLSMVEIQARFGVGHWTINRVCRRAGIDLRRARRDYYLRNGQIGTKNHFMRLLEKTQMVGPFSRCCVCGWDRATVDYAHMCSVKDGGKYVLHNVLPLCPNHHRLFDNGELAKAELQRIGDFRRVMRERS